jgi:glc operon protein GlcG
MEMAHLMQGNPRLTLEGANAILAAARVQAQSMGIAFSIAVVDDAGWLVAFSKMDDAKYSSIDIALCKAQSAAIRRTPTSPVKAGEDVNLVLSLALAIGSHARQTPIRGGLPLEANGRCIGAIGVSAGTEDQDLEVARAGVAALATA